jgi:hypothetical protein
MLRLSCSLVDPQRPSATPFFPLTHPRHVVMWCGWYSAHFQLSVGWINGPLASLRRNACKHLLKATNQGSRVERFGKIADRSSCQHAGSGSLAEAPGHEHNWGSMPVSDQSGLRVGAAHAGRCTSQIKQAVSRSSSDSRYSPPSQMCGWHTQAIERTFSRIHQRECHLRQSKSTAYRQLSRSGPARPDGPRLR